ncbi:hypothetical protein LIER_09387 [Lithospermum erythrorhizon]|uniref:Uncharacterized protein n=1 Tax=Lithospermum erythrorhizon TaxID=34254 RepID=A0AAV3PGR1_LITER
MLLGRLWIHKEEAEYTTFLTEFRDVFAWTYSEMPLLNPKIVVHHLSVKRGSLPVKQGHHRFRSELVPSIEVEVNRLSDAGFIRKVVYPTWLSNSAGAKEEWTNKGMCRF